jgi:hypothetical protein
MVFCCFPVHLYLSQYHCSHIVRRYVYVTEMAEPLGALLGFLSLLPFWSPAVNALLLSFVSGIMVYISFDELLSSTEGMVIIITECAELFGVWLLWLSVY